MIKLLIADDEKSTREGLIAYVPWEELGISVAAGAEDGVKALELALELQPHIVLTDVRMPKMNGIELANHLKEKLPGCKIIFLSGYSDKEYLKSAIELQAVSYIEKPVDLEEVKEVFKRTVSICKNEIEKKKLEDSLKSTVRENISYIREKLALELISSHTNPDWLVEKLKYIQNIDIHQDYFVSAIIKLKYTEADSPQITPAAKSSLLKEVEQSLNNASLNCICGFKDHHHILVHIYGSQAKSGFMIKKTFSSIMDNIKNIYHHELKLFISIGKRVKGVENIPQSYQTAAVALQKQFYLGYDQMAVYDERTGLPYAFDENAVREFGELIVKGKRNEAVSLVRKITGDLPSYDSTLVNNVKDFFFKIIVTLSRAAEEMGTKITDQDNKEDFFWNVISKTETLDEIESYITDKISLLFRYIQERESSGNAVFNAIKCIQSNYRDENLSIKDISEFTFLTPNYLCLLFKKETGKTINQYITEIRLEKAKEFLRDRRIKLYEVARCVGYSDPNYFAKIFKKAVGLTPSEYREKYLP